MSNFGLLPSTLALSVAGTAVALIVTLFHLGPGVLLYLAALGEDAIWLLPLHLAIALPPALFGGALLATSGPRTSDERPRPQQIAVLTLIVTLLSVYLLGWVIPAGYRATKATMVRYQTTPIERPAEAPAFLDLPKLLADPSVAAREDLVERVCIVVPCLVLGMIATGLVASPLSWSHFAALGWTAVVFIWQMRQLTGQFER